MSSPTANPLLLSNATAISGEKIAAELRAGGSDDKMVKAAKEFESFVMSQTYRNMYSSIEKSSLLGGGYAQDMFMGLYFDAVVKKNDSGPRGLAAMILKQMRERSSKTKAPSEGSAIAATHLDPTSSVSDNLKLLALGDDDSRNALLDKLAATVTRNAGKISSTFGPRRHPILGIVRDHHGVDIALAEGTELKSSADAKVAFAGPKGGYGNTVILDHGSGITSTYAHLSEISVTEGQSIPVGSRIGKVGSTGLSTGPHLHYEVRVDGAPVDPGHPKSGNKTQAGSTCSDKEPEA